MPNHKRRRRTFLLSAAGVVAVLALVMGIALYSPVLGVKTVVFEGNKLVSQDTLELTLAPVISQPLPQVTAEDVSALLESVVQIKSSRIEARPPSTLVVHVVERVPVALLKNGATYSLVDQDGVELGTTKDAAAAALPLIDGGKAAIGQDTFQAMTSVLATLPKSILNQLANATAKSPDAVELRLVDGRSVVWGNASDMELKAAVLESLLNAPVPTAQPGKPAPVPAQVFDVSAPRHPVTR
ncbi:cell division protein FtsQ/DivIB [Arthrobacter sp. Sr24]